MPGWFGIVKAGARRRNCHQMSVLHEGSPNFHYHLPRCHIVVVVLSTAYQWDIWHTPLLIWYQRMVRSHQRRCLIHYCHDMMVNHKMWFWRYNFFDRYPLKMVHTTDTIGLLLANEDHSPLPIHVRNKSRRSAVTWSCEIRSYGQVTLLDHVL